jgi:hypothetical protein
VVARPALPVLLLAALLALWLLWLPPSPDLAGQVYRVHLFAVSGFSLWDNNWYGGHYLPGYSLLFPPLGWLLGLHLLGVTAVVASTLLFARLARMRFGSRWAAATALFALSAVGDLYIGRIAFALGVSFGLGAVLATAQGRRAVAPLLSLLCAAASPVAGLFLALAAAADLLTNRAPARAAALAGPALALILALAVLFPEGGEETFAFSSLLAAAGLSALVMLLLPSDERLLRNGLALYLLALALSYLVPSPMGSNAVRLGVLFTPAILVGSVGIEDVRRAPARLAQWFSSRAPHVPGALASQRRVPHAPGALTPRMARLTLGALCVALLLWQLDGPVTQSVEASSDPSTHLSYYQPAIAYLNARGGGEPLRIEVPFTQSHWDATILAQRFALARGWDRQLDIRYDGLFYSPHLSAEAYRSWLIQAGTRFVALSDAAMDFSSRQEAVLIRHGLPYLRQVFTAAHWRIYEVRGALALASGPGRLSAIEPAGFTLLATGPGSFLVRIHYTPYWHIASGRGSIGEASGGWTRVTAEHPGVIAVSARL